VCYSKLDAGCLQDVETKLSSATSEKQSLELSLECAQADLTEQTRSKETLQLVSLSRLCFKSLY